MTRPLVIFGAVCVILLFLLVFPMWERQKEQALISALLGLKQREEGKAGDSGANETPAQSAADWTAKLELLAREHETALLLCQGKTREEIAAALALPVQQVAGYMSAVQAKLNTLPPVGRSIAAVKAAARYKLTGREAEVFDELLLGRSNQEIATALFVVEATVKFHVRNILKKAGAGNRSQLIAKLDRDIGQ
jgi:DNA-binding CsgD family transcriptional regulator